jgi:hypothetical protein
MRRKLLMVLLGLGAVAGFASGFARLCHAGYGHFGPGGHAAHRGDFERRVADTCAESAWRVYEKQAKPGPTP